MATHTNTCISKCTGALRDLYPQTDENLRNAKTIFWN